MRLLVCGGRSFGNHKLLDRMLDWLKPTVVIQGGAPGADSLAGLWASERKVKQEVYPALWNQFGAGAGPRRNQQMVDEGMPDLVIAFPGTNGTEDMVKRAHRAGIPVLRVEP